MKIAVVGTGISGMLAARLLADEHEVTVFEAADRLGGHTHTVPVELAGRLYAIDTGFIVYNERNYPNFTRLLQLLGVATQPSEMSFSVRCERSGLEYCGSSVDGLFAQRRNLVRPAFWRMLMDITRFNREASEFLDSAKLDGTLGDFLATRGFGSWFVERYLLPMGAAIWSGDPERIRDFPSARFLRFFDNHGLLNLRDRPRWRVICGGSARYVYRLMKPIADCIRLSCPVIGIRRTARGVVVRTAEEGESQFDRVVIAVHADQALRMLDEPTPAEREVLGAFRFQRNLAMLHTDASLLPRSRRAWASWNYHVPATGPKRVAVTYHMNRLQSLAAPVEFCVTLNHAGAIDPARVLRRITYYHPRFTGDTVAAQARLDEINGPQSVYYCGAYWGYGFHEDGVVSALRVAHHFDKDLGTLASCTAASTPAECVTAALSR